MKHPGYINGQKSEAPDLPTRIFVLWGLPHTVTPCFGDRLIQDHHRLYFLSDRALWVNDRRGNSSAGSHLLGHDQEVRRKLLIGELNTRHQLSIIILHGRFNLRS
ncbi:type IV toxin-antitoxin system YeeU family antitoxin [Aeromonas sp. 600584]|uniref:type IV toxin-antitoxin system YeeU family antitoxin n=1 Tax=Aeromonas sp. 600584 TaxID=2712030 RepID=UPI003BA0319F